MTNNDGWTEWKWTSEKPYPETLDTEVFVKFSDGTDDYGNHEAMEVRWWAGGEHLYASSWEQDNDEWSIVAYKIASGGSK